VIESTHNSRLSGSAGVTDLPCIDCLHEVDLVRPVRHAAPRPLAFWLMAALFAVIMLGTTLPTPLYVIYQARWHFSAAIITLIFAIYAAGVLAALLLAGRASDEIGRKPVLAAALGLSALSTVVFIVAPAPGWLFVGRILSGFSAGLATGTATATLTELIGASSAQRASLVATVANTGGLGLGPLLAGLIATFVSDPTTLVFELYLVALAVGALGLILVPETVNNRRKLTLRFSGLELPTVGRGEFLAAGAAAFAAFSVLGLFASLVPTFLGSVLHQHSYALSGATVFLIFASSAVTQLALAQYASRPVVLAGLGLFPVGLAMVVGALTLASLALFLLGTNISGIAAGAVFMGSLATANRLAPAETRGRIVSTYFVFAYVGISVPVIGVGIASEDVGDLRAVLGCAILLALLCVFSLIRIRQETGQRRATRSADRRRTA
jgi:MFS family permease